MRLARPGTVESPGCYANADPSLVPGDRRRRSEPRRMERILAIPQPALPQRECRPNATPKCDAESAVSTNGITCPTPARCYAERDHLSDRLPGAVFVLQRDRLHAGAPR